MVSEQRDEPCLVREVDSEPKIIVRPSLLLGASSFCNPAQDKMCIDHDMSYEHAGKRSAVPGKGPGMGVSHVVVASTEYFGDGGEPTLPPPLADTWQRLLEWDSKSPHAGL